MAEPGHNNSFVLQSVGKTLYEVKPIPERTDRQSFIDGRDHIDLKYIVSEYHSITVAADDVLVEVKKTGICGSDVHYLLHGRIGDFVVEAPMVLGHESAGIVHKVGPKVKHLKAGDRVAIEPGQSCRTCHHCKKGRYNLCPDMKFAATPPYDGTLGRYYKVPADLAYLLPESMSFEDGAMIEPLAVGVHSIFTLAHTKPNQIVAVFGAGPVGLLCMAVARAVGARRVIAIDIAKTRLEFAKTYAATDIFSPPEKKDGESQVEYSRRSADLMRTQLNLEERGAEAVDVIIEATGAAVCVQTGVFLIKPEGTFVQVGMGASEVTFPIVSALVKEIIWRGSFRYGPGDYELAIALVAQGKIDLKPLVTHRYKFDEAVEAFEAMKAGKGKDGNGVIKAMIDGPE
ncbi:hypothetical protein FRB96_008739 [Tulasnella sp. 330]|nr:hypothetical protein FRB96_008739 [Tulasnella sp. 330]KAG8875884.1 hypothetical protein FRB97_004653 [Tulasnella sp. 331]KAG8876195.1 hypothetical protein FRB98_007389 [Tulasnella sp. 332]